jgi:hypothetical protein
METEFEVVDIPVVGVFNKKSGELVNLVYKNEGSRSSILCDVSPSGIDSIKGLFTNLINSKKKDE